VTIACASLFALLDVYGFCPFAPAAVFLYLCRAEAATTNGIAGALVGAVLALDAWLYRGDMCRYLCYCHAASCSWSSWFWGGDSAETMAVVLSTRSRRHAVASRLC